MKAYDPVFVGFPTWGMQMPPPSVLEGYSTKGGVERDGILFVMEGRKEMQAQAEVRIWLRKIKVMK